MIHVGDCPQKDQRMSYTLSFQINALPKSPNSLLGAHWRTRSTHAKKWERLVWQKVWHLKPPAPLPKAQITMQRFSTRKMDADNLRSSFKPVLDALVKLGIIADDSMDVIGEPKVVLEKTTRKDAKIIITVEAV